ncbi:MAG TPA: hypothetical protein VG602_07125 [Actinomycetota bacterium]|nr:hypothetical protein [Actinomycetota bacterium]
MRRLLSFPFFLIAVGAFFLPFFMVTCAGLGELPEQAGQEPPEVTGYELAAGTAEDELAEGQDFTQTPEIPLPDIPGLPTPDIELPTPEVTTAPEGVAADFDLGMVQIYALAAAGALVLGAILSLVGQRFGGGMALLFGAAAAGALYLLFTEFKDVILDSVSPEFAALIEVRPQIGYWVAIGGGGVAALLGLLRLFVGAPRGGKAVGFTAAPTAAPAAADTTETTRPEDMPPPVEPPRAEPPPPPPPAQPPPTPPPPPSPPAEEPPEESPPPPPR